MLQASSITKTQHRIFISLLPALLLLSACGDSSPYVRNASGGGESRAQNFSEVSLSTFNGFSETRYSTLGSGFLGAPLALNPNQCVVVTTDQRLALISYDDVVWIYKFPDQTYPLPELASDSSGTVYSITTNGKLFAVDSSGSLKWEVTIRSKEQADDFSIPTWPLVVPGGIVVGMTDGSLKRFDFSGETVWEKKLGAGLCRSVAYHEEVGIAVGVTHNSYDREDSLKILSDEGVLRANVPVPRVESGPMIVGEDCIVIGAADRNQEGKYRPALITFQKMGKQRWSKPLKALPTGLSADDEGNVYVCGGGGAGVGGAITSFDRMGNLRWEVGLRQSIPASPVVASNMVCFVGTQDQSIGVFSYTRDGGFMKFAPIESLAKVILPPVILPSGMLVFSCSSEPIILKNRGGSFLGL